MVTYKYINSMYMVEKQNKYEHNSKLTVQLLSMDGKQRSHSNSTVERVNIIQSRLLDILLSLIGASE